MASVFKKVQRKGEPWFIDYTDENGKRKRIKGCTDRGVTEQIARKLESDVELRRRGVIDPRADARAAHAARPLADHLDAYHAHLTAKGATAKYAGMTLERARRVVALVKGATMATVVPPKRITTAHREAFLERAGKFVQSARLADLTADRVQAVLATLRDEGMSLQTANHHRTAIRGFSRWAWRSGRTADDPLVGVGGFNIKEDRRHDRRTLAVDELRRLIEAAHRGIAHREMIGPTRALCYRLAVATGLRFSEIKSITPESFDPDGGRPTVTVAASYTKNGEPATLPLPADLAETLAGFVASIPRGGRVFPLPDRGAAMLRIDLAAAGIPYRDDAGQVFDFHSLRCQCATLADQAGVSPRVVQRMMRHSTLELTGRYTRPRVADLEHAADSLPDLAPRPTAAEPLAATGTDPVGSATALADPAPSADQNATAVEVNVPKPFLFMMDASSERRIHNPRSTTTMMRASSPAGRLATAFVCSAIGLLSGVARADEPIRIIVFGAHPDDCELDAGGTAARWAKLGHKVKFVSTTNGDIGHHKLAGGLLARRRISEVKRCAEILGIETEVFDNHDGELMPTLENRKTLVRLIREWKADVVIGPRTNDYHPDHRYTGVLVQDAAFMVIVPSFCPDIPALRKNPVFLYAEDNFKKPNPFEADVVVPIDATLDAKAACIDALESQFYEWNPWLAGYEGDVPSGKAERLTWTRDRAVKHAAATADKFRPRLVEWLGPEKARAVKAAEAFEVCEYGSQPSKEELKRLFPFFSEAK